MARDISNLFRGNPPSKAFEFVSARKGPFTGKTLKLASDNAFDVFAFAERNKVQEKPAVQSSAV